MRLKIIFLLTATVVTAIPGGYRSSYSYQRASSSFINNELQHKTSEAGSYNKEGSTEGDQQPTVQSSYSHYNYRKPGANVDETSPSGLESQSQENLSGMNMGVPRLESSGRSYGGSSNYGGSRYRTSQTSFSSSNGQRNTYKPKEQGADKLEEIDDSNFSDYSRYQTHGFGRDYLEETEGHTRKPTQGTNIVHTPIRQPILPEYGSHTTYSIKPTVHSDTDDSKEGDFSQSQHKYDQKEMTQQSQVGFEHELDTHTDQSQVGFGNHGTQSGKHFEAHEMHQQSQTGYGKLEVGSHRAFNDNDNKELTQQSQLGFGKLEFGSHRTSKDDDKDLTQQSQLGFGELEFGSHTMPKNEKDLPQQSAIRPTGSHGHQSQTSYGNLEYGNSKHEDQKDLAQQSQVGFENLELGSKEKHSSEIDLTQQTQVGFEHNFEHGTHTDQPQVNFGSQSGKHEVHQQSQTHGYVWHPIGSNTKPKTVPEQSEVGFGNTELGSHGSNPHKPVQPQGTYHESKPGYGTLEFGSHTKPKYFTDQSQVGFEQGNYRSNPQKPLQPQGSQPGYGNLEFGSHTKPKTVPEQSQLGFGTTELGSHGFNPRKPLQPQGRYPESQPGYSNLEFGSHTKPKDITEQSQVGFGTIVPSSQGSNPRQPLQPQGTYQENRPSYGKLEFEDFTQQSQVGFGTQSEKHFDAHEMHQQSQSGYGKLEFGSLEQNTYAPSETNYGRSQEDQKDLTQQSQIGFENIDFGSHTKPKDEKDKTPHLQSAYGLQSGKHYELQTGYGKLEFGSHRVPKDKDDLPSQSGYDKSEFSSHKHEDQKDLTQQSQVGFENLELGKADQTDLTQQSQLGFSTLEFGNQGSHSGHTGTQQHSQGSYGKLEFGSHTLPKHDDKDLTQQSQMGFGTSNHGKHYEVHEMHQQSQWGHGKLEIGSQTQGKVENHDSVSHIGTGNLNFTSRSDGEITQQAQTGFGESEKEFWSQNNHETGYGKLETGSHEQIPETTTEQHRGFPSISYGSYGSQSRGQSSTSSYASSSRQYTSNYGSRSYQTQSSNYGNAPIKPVYEENFEDSAEQMEVIEDIAKFAQSVQDGSTQQKQIIQGPLEKEMEKIDNNKPNEHELTGIPAVIEEVTTKKPGFWKRLGSSITTTYETAKEKTKHVVEKVKHNLG